MESIALLSNSRDNGFTGVNLYCDDEASFVDAPPNPRATEVAFCCEKQMQVSSSLMRSYQAPSRVPQHESRTAEAALKEMQEALWVQE